jgi:hypothetical protein
MDPGEPRTFLFVAVGLDVQSDRVLTRLFPDQVAKTLGLEVIKELQPVVVAPCLVSLKPLVQFFLGESGNWTRSRWPIAGLATGGSSFELT